MERKYYFRGLGLGIVVTAVIMGIALSGGGKKKEMTDDEIIARAKALGMIEDSTLLESTKEEAAEDGQSGAEIESAPEQKENAVKKDIATAAEKEKAEEKASQEKQEEVNAAAGAPESLQEKENQAANEVKSGETEESKTADAAGSEEKKPSADTNEMTKQDEDLSKPETKTEEKTTKKVTISSGDGSYTVAKKLAEAGVVSSADFYDDFLCANGYDKKLRPGTFEIPAGANDEQIARIVTGQQ